MASLSSNYYVNPTRNHFWPWLFWVWLRRRRNQKQISLVGASFVLRISRKIKFSLIVTSPPPPFCCCLVRILFSQFTSIKNNNNNVLLCQRESYLVTKVVERRWDCSSHKMVGVALKPRVDKSFWNGQWVWQCINEVSVLVFDRNLETAIPYMSWLVQGDRKGGALQRCKSFQFVRKTHKQGNINPQGRGSVKSRPRYRLHEQKWWGDFVCTCNGMDFPM